MQLNFPRVFPKSKTKFTCFFNLSWSKDFPPVDTNMEVHKKWREHWKTEIRKYRNSKILDYRNTHVQLIGGLCALIGVFILALPVPIVVNRSLLNKTKNSSFINDHKKWSPIMTNKNRFKSSFFWLRLSRPWNRVDLREIPLSWKLDESENRDFDGLTLLNLCPQQSPFSNHTKWILFLHVAL